MMINYITCYCDYHSPIITVVIATESPGGPEWRKRHQEMLEACGKWPYELKLMPPIGLAKLVGL